MSTREHIKPGDQVVVVKNGFSYALATVGQVTKFQIVTVDGKRYRRSDGLTAGCEGANAIYIRAAIDEDIARLTYREATRRAEAALDTRRLSEPERQQSQTYKTRLLEAKAIIDAALGGREEA